MAGEEILVDVVGPITPTSLGGSRFFLTIVDTASGYSLVKILKAKSESQAAVIQVVKLSPQETLPKTTA